MENTFKTYLTVGLPKISVMFQFCCSFDYFCWIFFLFQATNLKHFFFFCILNIWHPFYQFAFKFSTLQFCSQLALIVVFKGLSQNMNTLEAVDCETVCQWLSSNQHRHHAKTKRYSTAANALHHPFKSIMCQTQHPPTEMPFLVTSTCIND